MHKFRLMTLLLLLVFTDASSGFAQETEVLKYDVSDYDLESLGWGRHYVPLEIINTEEYIQFVTVVTNVICKGEKYSPERKLVANYPLYANDTVSMQAMFWVPGNYGEFSYKLSLYHVIDTLDELLDYQMFFNDTGSYTIKHPAGIKPYLQKKVTLPPMVGRHMDLDYDFARIMPFLVSENKSAGEIAKLAGCDSSFVIDHLEYMSTRGFYRKDGSRYRSMVPTISISEAAESNKLAVEIADKISGKLSINIDSYWDVLDTLIAAGKIVNDSDAFMDGGSVLYRPYPVVTALSLWFDMGRSFITGTAPFNLFDRTDFCNAHIPYYMYMIEGDEIVSGNCFYAMTTSGNSYQIIYGDTIPQITCPLGFMFASMAGVEVQWEYQKEYFPESFMMDSATVRPMLVHLRTGIDPIMAEAFNKLTQISQSYNKTFLLFGHRWWFWNLVATRVIENLTESGKLTRRGNGQYRFDGFDF